MLDRQNQEDGKKNGMAKKNDEKKNDGKKEERQKGWKKDG